MDAGEYLESVFVVNEYPSETRPTPYKRVYLVNDGTPDSYRPKPDKQVWVVNNIPPDQRPTHVRYVYIVNDGTAPGYQMIPEEYLFVVNRQALPVGLRNRIYARCPACQRSFARENPGIGYDCEVCQTTWHYAELDNYNR